MYTRCPRLPLVWGHSQTPRFGSFHGDQRVTFGMAVCSWASSTHLPEERLPRAVTKSRYSFGSGLQALYLLTLHFDAQRGIGPAGDIITEIPRAAAPRTSES